jgi:hypothetical protein
MSHYDLCLAWNWEYDADFVHLIEAACVARGLSFLQVTSETLDQVLAGLENGAWIILHEPAKAHPLVGR